ITMAATRRHHTPRKHVSDLAGVLRRRQQAGELTIVTRPIDSSRDLLFGQLVLQNGLIDQVQLVAAFQSWTRDKRRPLRVHLVGRGDLDAEQRAVVEAMIPPRRPAALSASPIPGSRLSASRPSPPSEPATSWRSRWDFWPRPARRRSASRFSRVR